MNTSEKILSILSQSSPDFVSGEDIAAAAGVSRTSVWKSIKKLASQGYQIESGYNKGYRLAAAADPFYADGIELPEGWNLMFFPELPSTNAYLKDLLRNPPRETAEAEHAPSTAKLPEGTVVIAAQQTQGRGRLGRSFYSPGNTGVYVSILLRPDLPAEKAAGITAAAAVAVSRAIEEICGPATGIKWVNDIYRDGKKVCGILTEASMDMESGSLEYVIVGIGINVFPPEGGFPDEIKNAAGSVFDEIIPGARNRLCSSLLKNMAQLSAGIADNSHAPEYRGRSCVIGKKVTVYGIGGGSSFPATVKDIDDDCHLIVETEDGKIKTLSSGEISIRF